MDPFPAWTRLPVRRLQETARTTAQVAALPVRLVRLVGDAEVLLGRAAALAAAAEDLIAGLEKVRAQAAAALGLAEQLSGRAGATLEQAAAVAGRAAVVVERSGAVADRADNAVTIARQSADDAQQVLATIRPMVAEATPLARRFVDGLSVEQAERLGRLIGELPALVERLRVEAPGALDGLHGVGPDVSELLRTAQEVRHALHGLPGIGLLRRRGEDRLEQQDDARTDSESGPSGT
jgi:hypothetical protein